jgi:hypothetical protein
VRLAKLIVIRRVGDRRHVEDAVELLAAELALPIEARHVAATKSPR